MSFDTAQDQGVTLLWIESTEEWTAAGNHLRGTLQRLDAAGIPVREVITRSNGTTASRGGAIARILRLWSVVRRTRRAARPGVLLARWSPFLALATGAWKRNGGHSVVLLQGTLEDLYAAHGWTRRVPILAWIGDRSLRTADKIVVPSSGIAEWVSNRFSVPLDSILVLPNGVDTELYRQSEDELPVDLADEDYAVFVGNLAPWQGVDTILEAYTRPEWPAELRLLIIGDGEAGSLVQASAAEHPGIIWLGMQPKSTVRAALRGAKVSLATRKAVAASNTGVSPFKVLESAAAGTPVIATRVRGQTEMVEDIGGGVLIEPDDPGQLASAVALIVSDDAGRKQLCRAALEGSRRYDWTAGAQPLGDAIRTVREGLPRPQSGARLRVLMHPNPADPRFNAFVRLTAASVADQVDVIGFSWKNAFLQRYDVMHVHWPDALVGSRRLVPRLLKPVLVGGLLAKHRLTHVVHVSTVHNLSSHEGSESRFGLMLVRQWDRSCQSRVYLTRSAFEAADDARGVVIPHGDYLPQVTANSSSIVRSKPGRLVMPGFLRPYKGVETLISAVRGAHTIDPTITLDVRGKAFDPEYGRSLEQMVAGDSTMHIDSSRFLDDAELVEFVSSAEAIVLPYKNIYNSGVVFLALSVGRPVIATSSPSMIEVQQEVGSAWVQLIEDEWSSEHLVAAVKRLREVGRSERPAMPSREWRRIGELYAKTYRRAARRD